MPRFTPLLLHRRLFALGRESFARRVAEESEVRRSEDAAVRELHALPITSPASKTQSRAADAHPP